MRYLFKRAVCGQVEGVKVRGLQSGFVVQENVSQSVSSRTES